jgi:type I restriction enzyme S subunit
LPGTETTYKIFHRLHKNDFVLSQLKAWEGALARVTGAFDGWFLSPQFPTFRAKPDQLEIAYFDWYCKQSKYWDQLRSSARGMGARRDSVSASKFLSITIPLPPLAEQQRIVARIEELAGKIGEALRYRKEIGIQSDSLLLSAYHRIADSAPRRPMIEIAPLDRRPVTVDIKMSYPQVSVRSFGRGSFHKPPLVGNEVTWQKPFLVKSGDILISNIKAWEGALAVASPEDDGRVASHRYLTCVPASPAFWPWCSKRSWTTAWSATASSLSGPTSSRT